MTRPNTSTNDPGQAADLFDLQVNGYAGVDFNSDGVTVAEVAMACQRLERNGVSAILATVITAELDRMCGRIAAIVRAIKQSPAVARVIHGLHIEGPFLSQRPGFVGAHAFTATRPATPAEAEVLIDAGAGYVKLVTLAPECDHRFATTRWLSDRGIVVSAGHSDASLDQLRGAIDQGLTLFTHLGNACPLQMHRHDNIVQRVLSLASQLQICFIADGIHVPYFALRNYLTVAGIDRAIVVSDAIAAAGNGPGAYHLGDTPVVVDENLATWSSDGQHLVGSACPLAVAYQNLRSQVGLSPEEALRLTRSNPRCALGLDSTAAAETGNAT